jgi:hypothetical protein
LQLNLEALGTSTLPTLASFLKCIENKHTVMTGMYSQEIYETKQPTLQQRNDLKLFISQSFFSGFEINSCSLTLPLSVQDIYQVWEYNETGIAYCLLIEKDASFASGAYRHRMAMGWPILVRPKFVNFTVSSTYLHLSVPHIWTEQNTISSGASLFVQTRALSLMVQTRVPDALQGYPNCLNQSIASGLTDGMNSMEELFFDLNVALIDWQLNDTMFDSTPSPTSTGGTHYASCTTANCGFLQWYGTSSASCFDAYLSIGSGNESDYSYSPPNPAVTIHDYFNSYTSIYYAHTPYLADSCGLWGRDNLLGRYLNNIPSTDLCDASVAPEGYSQLFVSIQASPTLRVIAETKATSPLSLMGKAIKQTYDSDQINV